MAYVAKVTAGGQTGMLVGSTLYGACSTAAATVAKEVTISGFDTLITGVTIHVKFTYGNTAASPTLKVGSTAAKKIKHTGIDISSTSYSWPDNNPTWNAGSIVTFTYDGTNWVMNESTGYVRAGLISGKTAGPYSTTEGLNTYARYAAHAEGNSTIALSNSSHAEGNSTYANNDSHSEGSGTYAYGSAAHAEGNNTCAVDYGSHAEGAGTNAFGRASHAEGESHRILPDAIAKVTSKINDTTYDLSNCNFTYLKEGAYITNSASSAYAACIETISNKNTSNNTCRITLVRGQSFTSSASFYLYGGAIGSCSHTEGLGTLALGDNQHVFGKYNKANTTDVEIVGWGTSSTYKNIRTLSTSGNMTISGTLTQSSDARLKNVNGEIPDVSGVRAVRFHWNDTKGEHDNKDHIGYLAQDVEAVAPFLVENDSNGYKSLDYIAFLCAKVEMLEREVEELKQNKNV